MSEIAIAEEHFGIKFIRATHDEYYSPDGCPFCGDGGKSYGKSDRFRLMLSGSPRVWCRQCGKVMFLDSLDDNGMTEEEKLKRRMEAIERRQAEMEERMKRAEDAIEEIKSSMVHLDYKKNLEYYPHAVDYWHSQGFTDETINSRMLGYCKECPTARFSDSYTIPFMYKGDLYNIRHRLAKPNGTGKYRPHMAGLPNMLYNADDLLRKDSKEILILEGEKKSIMVTQEMPYFANVSIAGKKGFNDKWVSKFGNFSQVFVALDPDANEDAHRIASLFNSRGKVIHLPVKADDFFLLGGTQNDFLRHIEFASPV